MKPNAPSADHNPPSAATPEPLDETRTFLVIAADLTSLDHERTMFSFYNRVLTNAANAYEAIEGAGALEDGMPKVAAFDAAELRRLADEIDRNPQPPGCSFNLDR